MLLLSPDDRAFLLKDEGKFGDFPGCFPGAPKCISVLLEGHEEKSILRLS